MDKAKLLLANDIAYPNELLDDGKLNSYYQNVINCKGQNYSA